MVNFPTEHGNKEVESRFEQLVPKAFKIQTALDTEGVPSLIGGGVGVDLLVAKYIPTEKPRDHKDIDFYIPIQHRGRATEIIKSAGAMIDQTDWKNIAHGIAYLDDVRLDFFSIDGNGPYAHIVNPSEIDFLIRELDSKEHSSDGGLDIRHSSQGDINIDPTPDMVYWNGLSLRVMSVVTQLVIASKLVSRNVRDRRLLERMSAILGK